MIFYSYVGYVCFEHFGLVIDCWWLKCLAQLYIAYLACLCTW